MLVLQARDTRRLRGELGALFGEAQVRRVRVHVAQRLPDVEFDRAAHVGQVARRRRDLRRRSAVLRVPLPVVDDRDRPRRRRADLPEAGIAARDRRQQRGRRDEDARRRDVLEQQVLRDGGRVLGVDALLFAGLQRRGELVAEAAVDGDLRKQVGVDGRVREDRGSQRGLRGRDVGAGGERDADQAVGRRLRHGRLRDRRRDGEADVERRADPRCERLTRVGVVGLRCHERGLRPGRGDLGAQHVDAGFLADALVRARRFDEVSLIREVGDVERDGLPLDGEVVEGGRDVGCDLVFVAQQVATRALYLAAVFLREYLVQRAVVKRPLTGDLRRVLRELAERRDAELRGRALVIRRLLRLVLQVTRDLRKLGSVLLHEVFLEVG